MKKFVYSLLFVFLWLCLICLSAVLESCTATLRADKLWYNGNIARPVEYVVTPDSL